MRSNILPFLWHDKKQIYSVDYDPNLSNRFATCGGDNTIRLWQFVPKGTEVFPIKFEPTTRSQKMRRKHNGDPQIIDFGPTKTSDTNNMTVEYVATLDHHAAPVNVVRFSPISSILASAGDDGSVILWKKRESVIKSDSNTVGSELETNGMNNDEFCLEIWKPITVLRGSLSDIYDLSWSPDGKYLLTGSVDNTARIWDVESSRCVLSINDHKHYVQGTAWDPLNQFIVTQSSDRTVKFHKLKLKNSNLTTKCLVTHSRQPNSKIELEEDPKNNTFNYLYQNENLTSFFRRPTFTPDGSLIITPAGIYKPNRSDPDMPITSSYSVYIYVRNRLSNGPVLRLTGFTFPAVAIKCNPNVYKLRGNGLKSTVALDYRILFAVATQDSVYIYDTEFGAMPIAYAGEVHEAALTDIAWSKDGTTLLVTSSDGFVSVIRFTEEELGESTPIPKREIIPEPEKSTVKKPAAKSDKGGLKVIDGKLTIKEHTPVKASPVASTESSVKAAPTKRRVVPTFIKKLEE